MYSCLSVWCDFLCSVQTCLLQLSERLKRQVGGTYMSSIVMRNTPEAFLRFEKEENNIEGLTFVLKSFYGVKKLTNMGGSGCWLIDMFHRNWRCRSQHLGPPVTPDRRSSPEKTQHLYRNWIFIPGQIRFGIQINWPFGGIKTICIPRYFCEDCICQSRVTYSCTTTINHAPS